MKSSSNTGNEASSNTLAPNTNHPHVQFSWLPSLALGASSTVAIRIQSASLTAPVCSCLMGQDEKKDEHDVDDGEGIAVSSRRCRIEASIHLFGDEIQACPIGTRCVPIHTGCGRKRSTASYDAVLRLPVRWRDLTRDALLVLNAFCSCTNCDVSGSLEDEKTDRNSVWGSTLPLFDSDGMLRQGLYKLTLYPWHGDGGMGYQNARVRAMRKNDEQVQQNDYDNYNSRSALTPDSIESFLSGGATPGINQEEKKSHPFCRIDARKLVQEDPKWKASLILHELNHVEASSGTFVSVDSTSGMSGKNAVMPSSRGVQSSSMAWLDNLTKQRCIDIFNQQDDDDTLILWNDDKEAMTTRRLRSAQERTRNIMGTTGSITANELIRFHSKFRVDCDDDARRKDGCGSLTVHVSPLAVETSNIVTEDIPFPQSFLYPLVQTLDFEPPLADENEDNPFQDKYRILAHDLIRGLVDPGLKPDRIQRSRLERIVNSPNHHLNTEEKDLLWRFRFSLVDNRRALTKFLLAVDWSVESEVVQAAELLEQWRKRSPIEVTDALKLLGRNVAFQTSLVRSYAIETLSSAPDEELRLYLLQLVQALKYEEDVSGGASGGDDAVKAFSNMDIGRGRSRVSSLAEFLIERASTNIQLANFLYCSRTIVPYMIDLSVIAVMLS
ncbi:LOW QUALITY PROTEIN: hypothetical protein ACHAWX_006287 [Stephanocyclus meneghinianus]